MRWAEAECQRQQLLVTSANKQKVLGKALSLIRFPLMTIEEFAAGKFLWITLLFCCEKGQNADHFGEDGKRVYVSSSILTHVC